MRHPSETSASSCAPNRELCLCLIQKRLRLIEMVADSKVFIAKSQCGSGIVLTRYLA